MTAASRAWLVFFAFLGVYLANGDFLPGNDAKPNAWLAVNVLERGSLAFDPKDVPFMFGWTAPTNEGPKEVFFSDWNAPIFDRRAGELYGAGLLRLRSIPYYLASSKQGGFLDIFGPGASVCALPVFAAWRAWNPDLSRDPKSIWSAAKLAAAVFSAGSCAFVYLLAVGLVGPGLAFLAAVVYGLGSCTWSLSSQTLWQATTSQFFIALACWALYRAKEGAGRAALAGLACGAAAVCRPTAAVLVLSAAAWVAGSGRRAFGLFFAGVLVPAVAAAAYQWHYLGSPFALPQWTENAAAALQVTGRAGVWQGSLPAGLAGLLFSPSRGLLVFSPVFAFSFWGLARARRREDRGFFFALAAAWLGMLLLQAKWFDWWGGWSYGYRPIVSGMPLLAALLLPALAELRTHRKAFVAFGVLAVWSVAVQVVGVFAYDLTGWNRGEPPAPVQDVDDPRFRPRLWSLRDNEIAYYLRHFAEARRRRERLVRDWYERPEL